MFRLVRWMLWLIALVAMIGLAFLLGLSFGVGNNHDKFIAETVPILSMLGGWVSGLGALLAVGFALIQSNRQQEKERARCRIIVEEGEWFLTVLVVSEGIIPTNILSASISFDGGSHVYHLSKFPRLGVVFPTKLERGDVLTLVDVHRDDYRRLALCIADMVVADLKASELTPNINDKQKAADYFAELKACGERDAKLLLKTAHKDMIQSLPSSLMRTLFSLVESEHRMQWEVDREDQRKDLAKYDYLFDETDESPSN